MRQILDDATDNWETKVTRVELNAFLEVSLELGNY